MAIQSAKTMVSSTHTASYLVTSPLSLAFTRLFDLRPLNRIRPPQFGQFSKLINQRHSTQRTKPNRLSSAWPSWSRTPEQMDGGGGNQDEDS